MALVLAIVTGTPACGSAGGSVASTPPRDLYRQPFRWDSPWNLPLSTSARYHAFDTRAQEVYLDVEDISVDPSFPTRDLDAGRTIVRVHSDPTLAADGSYNNCSTFLVSSPDRTTVVQGQPLRLDPGGDPSYSIDSPPISLTGPGLLGCHGGSNLSGIGGSVRTGEMDAPGPLRHALKIGLNCEVSCSAESGGFRWPASTADRQYRRAYRGGDAEVHMGSLMALRPGIDPASFAAPDVRKLATALRDYGAYVVDSTGGPNTNSLAVQHGAQQEIPSVGSPEMTRLFRSLAVVVNSAASSPGGGPLGAPRRAPCASPFVDGTGGAPPGC